MDQRVRRVVARRFMPIRFMLRDFGMACGLSLGCDLFDTVDFGLGLDDFHTRLVSR
jgi:hypothetical protein